MNVLRTGDLLEDVKLTMRYSDCIGGLPFRWNDTLNVLQMKTEHELRKLGFRMGLATLYFILASIQAFIVKEQMSLMVITHSILIIGGMVHVLSCQIQNYVHVSSVVNLCNVFVQLEHHLEKCSRNTNVKHKRKTTTFYLFLRGMIYVMTFSGIAQQVVYFLDIFRNPCLPSYVGYWMSSQCENGKPGYYSEPTWEFFEVLTKVAIALAFIITWNSLYSGCCFQVALEYIFLGNCFRDNIKEFGRQDTIL